MTSYSSLLTNQGRTLLSISTKHRYLTWNAFCAVRYCRIKTVIISSKVILALRKNFLIRKHDTPFTNMPTRPGQYLMGIYSDICLKI